MKYISIAVAAVFVLALLLCSPTLSAQTTGVPNLNDYTINGLGSGSTSCTPMGFITPTVLNFSVSTASPGAFVFLLFSPGPCTPESVTMPTCSGTTFDLLLNPAPRLLLSGVSVPVGSSFQYDAPPITVPPVSPPITFSTQAVILDPICGTLPLFSQAYDVTLF